MSTSSAFPNSKYRFPTIVIAVLLNSGEAGYNAGLSLWFAWLIGDGRILGGVKKIRDWVSKERKYRPGLLLLSMVTAAVVGAIPFDLWGPELHFLVS